MVVRRILGVSAVAGVGLAMTLVAQTPQPQQPTFRSGVDLIDVDVSVLDKDRRPVKGLTAADFTVFEDGKARPIVAFATRRIPEAAASSESPASTPTASRERSGSSGTEPPANCDAAMRPSTTCASVTVGSSPRP